jgi:hypothetical protein
MVLRCRGFVPSFVLPVACSSLYWKLESERKARLHAFLAWAEKPILNVKFFHSVASYYYGETPCQGAKRHGDWRWVQRTYLDSRP